MAPVIKACVLLISALLSASLWGEDGFLTLETRNLYESLVSLSRNSKAILFGQQHATLRGVGWYGRTVPNRSDVKQVSGEYPAVYGWTIHKDAWADAQIVDLIEDAHARGGINTIHWQAPNPMTGGDNHQLRDEKGAKLNIARILKGGNAHSEYVALLDKIAGLLKMPTGSNGEPIPLLLRPFHEMNWKDENGEPGHWWGLASPEEYKQLWRETVTYLREGKGLRNLLFVYAPSGRPRDDGLVDTEEEYLEYYPGDEYVDVLALDRYVGRNFLSLGKNIRVLVKVAEGKGKPSALSEVGYPKGIGVPGADGWWKGLSSLITAEPEYGRLAYMLTWSNNNDRYFFVPPPGHPDEPDFKAFCLENITVFESELESITKH